MCNNKYKKDISDKKIRKQKKSLEKRDFLHLIVK